jgi:hypothetical protein
VSFGGLFQNQFNVWWAIMKWPKLFASRERSMSLGSALAIGVVLC